MQAFLTRAAVISELALPAAAKLQARALAGVLDAPETDDRQAIMLTSATEIELYVGRPFWRADGGGARTSTCEVRVLEPGSEIPVCALLPDLSGVDLAVTSVELWNDAAAFGVAVYAARPSGRIRVELAGIYRIVCELTPAADAPSAAVEGMARLFAYRTNNRPQPGTVSADLGGDDVSRRLQGAMLRSGAAEALRPLRIVPVV